MPLKVITPEGIEHSICSATDFEKWLAVCYLPSLRYADEKTATFLKKRYKKALSKQWITPRQKWLGHYYSTGLEGKLSLDLTISWINQHVGYGLFTNQPIPMNRYVGEYTGILRKRLFFCRKENLYCFDYTIGEDRSSSYVIDAKEASNHTRFINHSFTPNLSLSSVDHAGQVHVILYTARPIAAGEQLSYDYGDEYWRKRPQPLAL